MKKIITAFILVILFASCTNFKYDNIIVKDAKGNYYKLKQSIGVHYTIEEIDIKQIQLLDSIQ